MCFSVIGNYSQMSMCNDYVSPHTLPSLALRISLFCIVLFLFTDHQFFLKGIILPDTSTFPLGEIPPGILHLSILFWTQPTSDPWHYTHPPTHPSGTAFIWVWFWWNTHPLATSLERGYWRENCWDLKCLKYFYFTFVMNELAGLWISYFPFPLRIFAALVFTSFSGHHC